MYKPRQQPRKVSDKQKNQTVRIKEGVRTGELTRGEAAAMAKDQKELKRMKRRTKADGVVTRKERALLHKKANSNSKKNTTVKRTIRKKFRHSCFVVREHSKSPPYEFRSS